MSWAYVLVVCVLVVCVLALAPIVRADRASSTAHELNDEHSGNVRVLARDDWGFGEWIA